MTTAAWTGWAKLDTLIRSAGTSLSEPITDVRRGVPFSVSGRMIRYWFDGIGASPFGPDTLTLTQVGLELTIAVFLPMKSAGTPASDIALDSLLEEADQALRGVLVGDEYLNASGGNSAIGIETPIVSSASVENIGGAAVRVLSMPVTYGVPDASSISQ